MIKKLLIVLPCLLFLINNLVGQEKINLDDIKFDQTVFIFYGTPDITKSDRNGKALNNDEFAQTSAPMYATFTIHKKKDAHTFVIRFQSWSTTKGVFESKGRHTRHLANALAFNHIVPSGTQKSFLEKPSLTEKSTLVEGLEDEAFFTISDQALKDGAYLYNPKPRYEFNYGTVSYLARMRPGIDAVSGKWSTDLNLGLAAGIKRNYGENIGLCLLGGIAITKVNLDSVSTYGAVKTTSEKPALTLSMNLLFSYKNFSIGFGVGKDWINEDSKETAAWIYNKKVFYAVGFGINIFRSSSNENTTARRDQ